MRGAYYSWAVKRFLETHPEFTAREFILYIVEYGLMPGSARNWLVKLEYLGVIERIGRGKYRVVNIGKI